MFLSCRLWGHSMRDQNQRVCLKPLSAPGGVPRSGWELQMWLCARIYRWVEIQGSDCFRNLVTNIFCLFQIGLIVNKEWFWFWIMQVWIVRSTLTTVLLTLVLMVPALIWPMTTNVTVRSSGRAKTVTPSWTPAIPTPVITVQHAQPRQTSQTSPATVLRDSQVSSLACNHSMGQCTKSYEQSWSKLWPFDNV